MRHPVGGATPEGRRRWRVKYDKKFKLWFAFPTDETKSGWAFAKWEDAYRYAHSNGRIFR